MDITYGFIPMQTVEAVSRDSALMLSTPKTVADILMKATTILLVAHRRPDGDTIGSMLGLGLALERQGKRVIMACEDPIPERLRFLPDWERVVSHVNSVADVSVAVDCGDLRQLGSLGTVFQQSQTAIQIDHHELGHPFTHFSCINMQAAAVGEMIYGIIAEMGLSVSKDEATCLLTSIMVDTGGFTYPNAKADTFTVAGELMRAGADYPYLIEQLFWNRTAGDIILAGKVASGIRFSCDGAIVWTSVTDLELARHKALEKEVGEVVNHLRTISGVRIAVMFREHDESVRVSLRSRGRYNVAEVAARFGGGGHMNASGCTINKGDAARAEFMAALEAACRH